jgi:hypothetical protein
MKLHLLAKHARSYTIAQVGLIVLTLLGIAPAFGHEQTALIAAPAAKPPVVLYDAALGTTPDQQQYFQYQAINGANPLDPFGSALAKQKFENGATTLDTTFQNSDLAGYGPKTLPAVPVLDRHVGYSVSFTIQIQQEDHTNNDRAGFSVIVLSSDKKGVELAFWKDQIWIQNDGTAEPPSGTLFTHGEGAAFDTTTGLVSYTLSIKGASYSLSSGVAILSGSVRDYTAWEAPPLAPVNPYRTPNLIVLSDDTTSASAKIRLTYVAVTLPNYTYLPLLRR